MIGRRHRSEPDSGALDQLDHRFAEVSRHLRDAIIEHYRSRGDILDTVAGRRTLDTNTVLAGQRGRLLLRLLARSGGPTDLRGLAVADIGCGFGSLGLYFALAGASVTGIDPNIDRAAVAGAVAGRLGLDFAPRRGWLEDITLPDDAFDVVILNNSLCYIEARADRRAALAQTLRIVRPGGWTVLRNPARLAPLDPFTGRPFLHQLPAPVARWLSRRRTPARSPVRLHTAGGQSRELRRAGFGRARRDRLDQPWWRPPRYLHHTARRRPV